ncbi:hypothetical protein G6F36_011305 [Rhizopus arrhizus]|nr:hypothetical protein G6F36_011305 [Rhizopus arrhizus]
MPPTRGPYNKVQPPPLSEEQLAELNSLFTKYRKNLTCPACKTTTTFHRHGASTRDPTQPQFTCTSCRKYVKAHSMYQLVQLAATFDDQSSQQPDDMDLVSNNLEESTDIVPPTLEEPHSVVQQLQKTVEFLTAELAKAHLAIQNLQNQLQTIAPHASQRPIHTDVTSFPTVTESSTNNKTQFPDAPWHNPAKVDAIKQPLLRQRELRRAQREAAAARFFQPPSPNQGFKYLYIPTKARIPVGTLL